MKTYIFCLAAMLPPACFGQVAGPPRLPSDMEQMDVKQAIAEAIDRNLGLLAERANLTVAEAARISARLRPNPVVSAAADHLNNSLGTRFSQINAAGPTEISLRVDLPIERARKRELRLETATLARTVAEAQLENAIRRLRLDVQLACIDILEAKTKLSLARDNLQALERLVSLNESRLASGAIAPLEVTRTKVAMLQYRTSVRAAELELATSRARLAPLLGRRSGGQVIDIAGELPAQTPPRRTTLDEIESLAIANRPDLAALQREQARTQADLRLQIAQGKVDYSVGMEYRRQQGINGTGNMLGFFVSAPLPVFNRNQGEIARATAEGERTHRSIRAAQNEILSEVFTAHQEYQSALRLVDEIQKELLVSADEARKTTAYVYQSGATTLLDALDSQRAFNETMLTYYTAQANLSRVATRLAAAAGLETLP